MTWLGCAAPLTGYETAQQVRVGTGTDVSNGGETRTDAQRGTPRRRWRWRMLRWAGAVVALAAIAFVARILWLGGVFRRITPHFDGTCRLIDGPVGPEDITINQRTGRAYISASDRRASMAQAPVPGAIWSYDLTDDAALPVNLTPDAGIEFQPHGISLWDAAAAPRSQAFLLVGTLFLLPVIVAYTAWSYWVFHGKVWAGVGYH